MAKVVQQGTIARRSIPDSIIFEFRLPGNAGKRVLTGYTARITIMPPDDTPIYGRPAVILDQESEETRGQVRYDFQNGDFALADAGSKTTRVQCTISKPGARHISDIASIKVADTPASGDANIDEDPGA